MVKFNDKLSKLQQKINYFINYDLEVNLLSMNIGLKNELKDQLFNIIEESYYVDVEFLQIQGQNATIKHILQKDKFWGCICGELVQYHINI